MLRVRVGRIGLRGLIAAGVFGLAAGAASAETTTDEFFNARGFGANRDYFSQLPYEHIDPLTGNLLLTFTDLVLPGNAGFDLSIQRTYNSKIYLSYPQTFLREDSWAGVGWTLHMGRIRNPTAGTPGPIEMPDGSQHELFTNSSPSGTFISRGFWIYDKNPATPVLKLTNGLVYFFGHSTTIGGVPYLYVTRIEDPFGNSIAVTYMNAPVDGIASITQDLGGGKVRTITFTADTTTSRAIATMTHDSGPQTYTWTYTPEAAPSAGFSRLKQVQPPVGPAWKYQYDTAGAFIEELIGVTTPNGGQIDYTYADVQLNLGSTQLTTTPAVVSRTVSGPNLAGGAWSYAYGQGASKNQTVITAPSSCVTPSVTLKTTYTFLGVGTNYATGESWNVGLVSAKAVTEGPSTLEATSLTWRRSVAISLDQQIVGPNVDTDTYVPLLDRQEATRGGHTYTTDPSYATTNFNDYGRANSIQETGDLSRTTTRTFDYNFTPYIKDRLASETVSMVGGGSFTRSYEYDDATGFKDAETLYGVRTTFEPFTNDNGNVESATDANFNKTTYTYDWGVVKDVFTPVYYPTATISRVINPEGTIASETRRVQTATGVTSFTTSFTYDKLFRITQRKPPVGNGSPVDTTYDNTAGAWFRVTRDPDATGTLPPSVVTSYLDGFGRVYREQNSLLIRTDTQFNACGLRTFASYPYTGTPSPVPGSTLTFDSLGRVKTKVDPGNDSGTTKVTYSYPGGVDVKITDELNHVTEQQWAAFGDPGEARLMSVKDADFNTTAYDYNALGNLTLVDPPSSAPRQWTYFPGTDQLDTETHPENGTTKYTHYPNGLVKTRTDAANATTTFYYDFNNRLTSIDRPGTDTTYNTTIKYDPSDNRTQLKNSYVDTSFIYDGASRLASRTDVVSGKSLRTSYSYDGNDNVTRITYPSARQVNYTYDRENRTSTVKLGTTNVATGFTYHPSGALDTYLAGSGLTHDLGYNNRYRLKTVNTLGTTPPLLNLTYGYDNAGNVASIDETTRSGMNQVFGYDALDRLKTATGPWGSASFGYNDIGDRTSKTVAGLTTDYTHDTATNRLTSASGAETESFGYDSKGNLTANATGTYTFTTHNMMETATVGGTTTYRYDGDELRKLKIGGGWNSYYLHGPGGLLLGEYTDSCTGGVRSIKDYVYAGTRLLAIVEPPLPTLSFGAASVSVAENAGSATVSATLTTSDGCPTTGATSATYATANGTATAMSDYVAIPATTLPFPAGTASGTSQTFPVAIVNDWAIEANETFTVTLSNPNGATLGTAAQTITILDNDTPTVAFVTATSSVSEGDGVAPVTVRITTEDGNALQEPASVVYATTGGTTPSATAGSDYVAIPATTLPFPAGTASGTATNLSPTILPDPAVESDENFNLVLSAPVKAKLGSPSTHTITILDDEPTVGFSVSTSTWAENGGAPNPTTPATVTVALKDRYGNPTTAANPIMVAYATADGTAIAAKGDYVAASGTLSFEVGQGTLDLDLTINDDNIHEGPQSFSVTLSNPTAARLGESTHTLTIQDDEARPVPSVSNVSLSEGNSGSKPFNFGVTLSGPSETQLTFYPTTFNGVGYDGTASPNQDYQAIRLTSAVITFLPGETQKTFPVTVYGDTTPEPNESFFLRITNPACQYCTLAKGQGTILNDDGGSFTSIQQVPYQIGEPGLYRLSTDLTTDLVSGAAITVQADDVEIDMGGRSLQASQDAGGGTVGIEAVGRRRVSVLNGTITGFGTGVRLVDGDANRVEDVLFESSAVCGIEVSGTGGLALKNRVVGTGRVGTALATGILAQGNDILILDNDVLETAGAEAGHGIRVQNGQECSVGLNRIGNSVPTAGVGISVSRSGGEVLENRITTTSAGVVLDGSVCEVGGNVTSGVATPYVGTEDTGTQP